MRALRIPQVLVGGIASLPDLFLTIATTRGLPREEAEVAAELLPEIVRVSPCFLDRLHGLWRYDFGDPYHDHEGNPVVFGTPQCQSVERLFAVILCARVRLRPEQLSDYMKRLADPKKHEDLLIEFAPILRLDQETLIEYEVSGYGEGESRIDWLLSSRHRVPILLDIKNRTRDLLESLARIQVGERGADDMAPAPTHDTALIFRSLERKFRPSNPANVVQGGWITTQLMQEESELQTTFSKLDCTRVHFAILGDWEDDVYVLCNYAEIKQLLLEIFNIRESKRFVFNREEG